MIDTTTLTNRPMRYKEYERLRNVPEIESAMQVFADEACVAGDTKIATPFGFITIKELAEKKSEDRFLVYCYDFAKKDYTLGWAYSPRLVKEEQTITIILDSGTSFSATADHRVLRKDGTWAMAGQLKFGDELMPFNRQSANTSLTKRRHNQYARLFSFEKGWIHERQFVDDWKSGKTTPEYEQMNRAIRMIGGGLTTRQIEKKIEHDWDTIENWLHKEGFSHKEVKRLYKTPTRSRIIGIHPGPKQPVYDLSVDDYKCFATDSVILHNCQKDEEANILKVEAKNDEIKEEIEFLLLHRKMLNMNRNGSTWFKNLCIFGDWFVELVVNPDNPKEGIYRGVPLPVETMFRIESIKGKVIEFQQSKEAPDYQALLKGPLNNQNEMEMNQSTAIRFAPSQIIHFRIGDDRKTFFPYGQSLIEPARAPAHSLRMMEDAMLVYRLCLVGDTRIRTKHGYKYIKDIKEGDVVYCMGNDGIIQPVKVSWFVNNGVQQILKVKTQHTQIKGTVTHPLLVNRNGVVQWVDMQDIQAKTDKLVNITQDEEQNVEIPKLDFSVVQLKREFCIEKIDPNKLKTSVDEIVGEKNIDKEKIARSIRLFLSCKNRYGLRRTYANIVCNNFGIQEKCLHITKRKTKQFNLPDVVDEDFARLFGFMLGDGSIRRSGTSMCFSASPDAELNDFYRGLLQQYFGNVHFEKDKRSKHKECGNYVVSSVEAVEIMLAMGYRCKTEQKTIPTWVYSASKKVRRAFIEGISDADGCERFTKAGLWFSTISMSNKTFIEGIKEIWHGIGLCSGQLGERTRKSCFRKSFNRQMPETKSYHITITDRILPKYDTVWSVTKEIEEEVYDFTVDHPNHNFVANGVCSANTRAPERRVFYIDVGQLPPFKAEAFIDRLKDQFRKRKVTSNRGGPGANSVEEKWQPPAQDEDYWLPIRPNSQTRIDTLPGAENLGEIDDAVYFRNKLLTALNFPKNYFNNEDPGATRITLSAQDVKFARMIERLQSHFEDGILEIAERHLQLRGFPEESYKDLRIKMTPPSDWRELSRAEVVTARYGNAGMLKSGQLMADYDIYVKIMKYSEEDSKEMLARLKLQKLEDLKLQVLAQNPALLGIGIPGQDTGVGQEIGSNPGGPNAMPSPDGGDGGDGGTDTASSPVGGEETLNPGTENGISQTPPEGASLPDPDDEDVKKYDLEIQDYESEEDQESIDYSVGD